MSVGNDGDVDDFKKLLSSAGVNNDNDDVLSGIDDDLLSLDDDDADYNLDSEESSEKEKPEESKSTPDSENEDSGEEETLESLYLKAASVELSDEQENDDHDADEEDQYSLTEEERAAMEAVLQSARGTSGITSPKRAKVKNPHINLTKDMDGDSEEDGESNAFEDPEDSEIFASVDLENLREVARQTRDRRRGADDEEELKKQMLYNRSRGIDIAELPKDVVLIDDPEPEESAKKVDESAMNPGDNKTMKVLRVMSFFMVAVIILGVVGYLHIIKRDEEARYVAPTEVGQNIGAGDVLGLNETPTTSSISTDVPDSIGEEEKVEVPAGGSKVTYKVSVEDGIKAASVAYIDGDGKAQTDSGIILPWSKTIGAEKSVSPHIAVTTSGYGTVTCSIYQNSKKISEKTISGESPSIECIP